MAVKELTTYAPYVTLKNAISAAVTGIIDYVKVTSDLSSDDCTLKVIPIGETEKTIHISSGDALYGPFSSVEVTAITDAQTWVLMYERSKTIIN